MIFPDFLQRVRRPWKARKEDGRGEKNFSETVTGVITKNSRFLESHQSGGKNKVKRRRT